MSATILPFTGPPSAGSPKMSRGTLAALARHFDAHWPVRHLPLVMAALDMLQVDDGEFARRCTTIAGEPGAIDRLTGQLRRLASNLAGAADALVLTAQRIATVAAALPT